MIEKIPRGNSNIHDVVCGMDVTDFSDLVSASHENKEYFFCGAGCVARFNNNPKKFLGIPLLDLHNVEKIFKLGIVETPVLRRLSLHIWEGDFVAIIGSSGSGKSTLLNMLGFLDRPTGGSILLKGKDVVNLTDNERAMARTKTFGFVFQQYNLIPWLNARDNIYLPRMFSLASSEKDDTLEKQIEFCGISSRLHHRPLELSGGEQQRVALVRALSNDPLIILGDEPTGNLDSTTGNQILSMLVDLNRKQGKTLIIVTHDADIAEQADEVITIKDGKTVRDHRVHRMEYTEEKRK
ncbi:MAG: ATP-binding cassette domain-containing protein [Patescibacteria group bacterium]